MQILLAFLAGAVIGLAAHFQVRRRDTRGAALIPVLGALVAGAAWLILTWAGIGIDSPWPWLSAVVVPAAVCWPTALVLTRMRVAGDARDEARLGLG